MAERSSPYLDHVELEGGSGGQGAVGYAVTSADYTLYVQQRNTAVVYNQRLPAVSVNLPVVCQLSLPVGQLVSVANNDSTQT